VRIELPAAFCNAPRVQHVTFHVREGSGAAYETWLTLGRPQNLSRTEEEAFRLTAEPAVTFGHAKIINGAAVIELDLAPCEFAFIELSLPGTPSKERAEEQTAGSLNDLLSYKNKPTE